MEGVPQRLERRGARHDVDFEQARDERTGGGRDAAKTLGGDPSGTVRQSL